MLDILISKLLFNLYGIISLDHASVYSAFVFLYLFCIVIYYACNVLVPRAYILESWSQVHSIWYVCVCWSGDLIISCCDCGLFCFNHKSLCLRSLRMICCLFGCVCAVIFKYSPLIVYDLWIIFSGPCPLLCVCDFLGITSLWLRL